MDTYGRGRNGHPELAEGSPTHSTDWRSIDFLGMTESGRVIRSLACRAVASREGGPRDLAKRVAVGCNHSPAIECGFGKTVGKVEREVGAPSLLTPDPCLLPPDSERTAQNAHKELALALGRLAV